MSTSKDQQLLYHYTSFHAFESIIRSQVLWATHFWGSNDKTEFVHLSKPMREALARVIERIAIDPRSDRRLRDAIDLCGDAHKFVQCQVKLIFEVAFGPEQQSGPQYGMSPPFTSCFCDHSKDDRYTRENGLLSMWRGYGSSGVALVFDREKLQACLDREREEVKYCGYGQLLKVAYGLDDDAFEQRFGKFVALLKGNALKYLLDHKFDADFHKLLFEAAAGYKHRAFEEEREVRIALFPHTQHWEKEDDRELKPIKINEDGCKYIEIFGGTEKLPITKVIVGPHKYQDARVSNAREVLRAYPDVQFVPSRTPYKPG